MNGWRIGTIRGTPVYLARSWPLGVLLLGTVYYSSLAPLGTGRALGLALLAVVLLFASVFAHELSHGLAGRALGRPPLSYTLTIWGGATSFRGSESRAGTQALIALAGPATNLVLAGAAWALLAVAPASWGLTLASVAWMNMALGLFNLLPGLPMDGGHVVQAVAWKVTGSRETAMLVAAWSGMAIAVAVLAAGVVPLLLPGTGLGSPSLWLAVVGLMLFQGALRTVRVAKARRSVTGVDLRRFMTPIGAVDSSALVRDVPPPGAVVLHQGRVVGLVTPLPPGVEPMLPVSAVARVLPPEAVLAQAYGPDAVAALGAASGVSDVVVLRDGERYLAGSVAAIAGRLG